MTNNFLEPIVTIVAIRESQNGQQILMQKRVRYFAGTQYHNYWELPQGKIEKGEDILSSAKRELKEETGLEIIKTIELYSTIHNLDKHQIQFFNTPLCSIDLENGYIAFHIFVNVSGKPTNTFEAKDQTWLLLDEIKELLEQDKIFPLNIPILYNLILSETNGS